MNSIYKKSFLNSEDIKEFLVYARRTEIRGISLDPSDTVDKIIPIMGAENAIGIDFHFNKSYIYWTDVTKDSISRIFINGTGREDIIPSGFLFFLYLFASLEVLFLFYQMI